MTSLLWDLFGVRKPIIAMLHLPGLPGRPRHDRQAGMRPIVDTVARDLAALQEAGVDGLRAAEFMTAAKRARESAVNV